MKLSSVLRPARGDVFGDVFGDFVQALVSATDKLHPAHVVLAASLFSLTQIASGNQQIPDIDGVYVIDTGVPVALAQTPLRAPILLDVPVSNINNVSLPSSAPIQTVIPVIDTDDAVVLEFYIRDEDAPDLKATCYSMLSSGDLSAETKIILKETAGQSSVRVARCAITSETAFLFLKLGKPDQVIELYAVCLDDAERTLSNLLAVSDMDLNSLLDIAAVVLRTYPENQRAKQTFAELSPFQHRIENRSTLRLPGQSLEQFRKQEKHSFGLARRNGISGRGYRLQHYLRDYPNGVFAPLARMEILAVKRAAVNSQPGWAELRAEKVLRVVMLWDDNNEQKIAALKKYTVAYPNARLNHIVRSEIARLTELKLPDTVAQQMAVENQPIR